MLFRSFAALIPFVAIAKPVDLLTLKPTQTMGSVERTATGETELNAGFFSVAGIYQQMPLKGKSFDISAVFTRSRGSDGIGFVIPVGQQKVAAVFGGWGGRYDGLYRVDGMDPSDSRNPTRRNSKLLNGDAISLKISVRPNKVSVYANGELHFDLDPGTHQLSVLKELDSRFQDGLGVYVINGTVSFESWSVEELP